MSKDDEHRKEVSVGSSEAGSVRLTVPALFFLSGACGLIYEVVWMRMLTLVFGATAFATSTVLASLFAGLALGGFYFGRVIDRGRRPLTVYALLEAGIGVFAFIMPLLLAGLNEVYVVAYQRFSLGFYQLSLLRFSLSFLVLLLPATLMGGTLPVIIKFFAKRRERLGWDVGRLYAINTFGAVVGTLSAGFFLILMLGVKEAAYVAGVINLLIAGVVLILDRRLELRWAAVGEPQVSKTEPEEMPGEVISSRAARLALWAVGLSGFCALALEVFLTRSLVFFLDNSTHAFTTILTAFLLGIAVGSLLIARFIDTRKKLLGWLGLIQICVGVSAILAIPILNNSTPVIQSMVQVSLDSMLHWKWIGMRFFTSLTVLLVPTVLMGMTFPLASKIYARNVNAVGAALGNVYAVNTIGGVLGSVVAGFVLIPLIGVHDGIILIATINVIVGEVLILSDPLITVRKRMMAAIGVGVLFAAAGTFYLTRGATPLTSYYERVESAEVLSYDEGIGATVKVFEDVYGDKLLSINGFPVAGTPLGLHDAQMPLAHLALLLSNTPSPRVNIIGFGTGGTSWGIMQYDVERVDCVELVPGVIDAAGWFPEINHGVLDEPNYNLIMGDGRNYALVTDEQYDVISIDATSPKMAGNGSLYSREFYELLKQRLTEDGLVVQWLPLHLLSDGEVRMITKSLMTVFPHSTLWLSPLRQHSFLVGTQNELEIDFDFLSEKLEREGVQAELTQLMVSDPVDFLSWFVMGEEALAEYVGDIPINTDNHPYLEFTPAMAYFVADRYLVQNRANVAEYMESVFPMLVNTGETEEEVAALAERVERRFQAREHSIRGDNLLSQGRREEAIVAYNTALLIDPEEKNWANPVWLGARPQR